MATTLKDYLQSVYPTACRAVRKATIRAETTSKEYFEIKDLEESEKSNTNSDPVNIPIIKDENEGVACFYNPKHIATYIVDFEYYINGFRTEAARGGRKCDFILSNLNNNPFIILNELKKRKEGYIKEEEAIAQLNASIEKLSKGDVPFLSQFKHKVALLSYRLTDSNSPSLVAQGIGRFSRSANIGKNISLHAPLQAGFVFEQRIYPEKFELPPEEHK